MSHKSLLVTTICTGGLLLCPGLAAAGERDGHPKGPVLAGGMGGMNGMGGMGMGPGGMGGMGMGGMGMGPGGMGMDMGPWGPGMRMGDCPMMGGMSGMGGMGMGGMGGMGGMAGDLSFDVLRSELGITEAQRGDFNAYADAMGKHLARMRAMHETMRETRNTGTAPERLERRITMFEQHAAALKDLKGPLTAVYNSLSDEQKRKADGALFGCGG
jgi:hypothetical protein